MMPATVDLCLYRGDTFEQSMMFTTPEGDAIPLPATGWRAWADVQSEDTEYVVFDVDTTGADDGVLVLRLTAEQTALIEWGGTYDVEHGGDTVRTWVRGAVAVTRDVTR